MRPIGRLQDENQARRFGDFLYAQGIENQVDPDLHGTGRSGSWTMRMSRRPSRRSTNSPSTRTIRVLSETARAAAQKRKQDEQAQIGKRTRMIDGRTIFYSPPVPIGILTIILIVISVAVTLLTDFGKKNQFVQPLSITQYQFRGNILYGQPGLPEIRHGQIWRLFTPMFLHFDFLHIFFNMLWLRDLGSMIEARKSLWTLLLLVLVIAGTSNLAQYLVSGPTFGGMSGVVYGLLGYIWMQGKFNPASKLSLEPQTVLFMIVWFFLCLFGLVGNVANVVHAVGLVVGIAWGFLAAHLSAAARRG